MASVCLRCALREDKEKPTARNLKVNNNNNDNNNRTISRKMKRTSPDNPGALWSFFILYGISLCFMEFSFAYTGVWLCTWYWSDILCWMYLPVLWMFTLAVWIPYATWNYSPLLTTKYGYGSDINACTWKDWYELTYICDPSLGSCFPYLTDWNLWIE